MIKRNQGFAFTLTAGMVIALAIGIPILALGLSSVIKAVQIMFFSPVTGGKIPVWTIIAAVMVILYLFRRSGGRVVYV